MYGWFERAINSDAKFFIAMNEFDIDAVILKFQGTSGSRTDGDVTILVFLQRKFPSQWPVLCVLKVTLAFFHLEGQYHMVVLTQWR